LSHTLVLHSTFPSFPPRHRTNGKGKEGRGIGSHTDYGLLVIAAQDEVGGTCKLEHSTVPGKILMIISPPGLFIRRPHKEEKFANWEKSAAGLKEDAEDWYYIPPVEGTHTVILGKLSCMGRTL